MFNDCNIWEVNYDGNLKKLVNNETPQTKNSGVYIEQDIVKPLIDLLSSKLKEQPILTQNEVYYFSNNSRLKLENQREILQSYSPTATRTIFPDMATTIVFNTNEWEYKYPNCFIIKKDNIPKFAQVFGKNTSNIINNKDLVITYNENSKKSFMFTSNISHSLQLKPEYEDLIEIKHIHIFNYHGYKNNIKILENTLKCCKNTNVNFITDIYFKDVMIHQNGIEIDYGMFQTLSQMFESKDHNDIIMAYNIIQRCNFDKSSFWLEVLEMMHEIYRDPSNDFEQWVNKPNNNIMRQQGWSRYCEHLYEKYHNDSEKVEFIFKYCDVKIRELISNSINYLKTNNINSFPEFINTNIDIKYDVSTSIK